MPACSTKVLALSFAVPNIRFCCKILCSLAHTMRTNSPLMPLLLNLFYLSGESRFHEVCAGCFINSFPHNRKTSWFNSDFPRRPSLGAYSGWILLIGFIAGIAGTSILTRRSRRCHCVLAHIRHKILAVDSRHVAGSQGAWRDRAASAVSAFNSG